MRYDDFLEESYAALRASAPFLTYGEAWAGWLRQVGELLASLEGKAQHYWVDQFTTLLVVKYGGLEPVVAFQTVWSAVHDAERISS